MSDLRDLYGTCRVVPCSCLRVAWLGRAADLPAVGDWIALEPMDSSGTAARQAAKE
mgnify:CR=1 FL=1